MLKKILIALLALIITAGVTLGISVAIKPDLFTQYNPIVEEQDDAGDDQENVEPGDEEPGSGEDEYQE